MRNYWVYQSIMGAEAPSLSDLAQHRWPYMQISARVALREQ